MNNTQVRLASEVYYGITFIAEHAGISLFKSKLYGGGIKLAGIKNNPEEQLDFAVPKSSFYGTPVMSALVLGDPDNPTFTYLDIDGNEQTANSINLECCLMTVSNERNIIKTSIEGRNGTVKQYISEGDYKIDVNVTIATVDNNYPRDLVNDLVKIFSIPDAVPIYSSFLNIYGIASVVIESSSTPQEEGFYNQQKITFTMISDIPLDLNYVSSKS